MPRLEKRQDGGFFILHGYGGPSTWQIGPEGISYLKRRGVKVGAIFDKTLFFELHDRGLIWTESYQIDRKLTSTILSLGPEEKELKEKVDKLYAALYKRDWVHAFSSIYEQYSDVSSAEDLSSQFEGKEEIQIRKWKANDFVIYGSKCQDFKRIGLVDLTISILKENEKTSIIDHREEYWGKVDNTWKCGWHKIA